MWTLNKIAENVRFSISTVNSLIAHYIRKENEFTSPQPDQPELYDWTLFILNRSVEIFHVSKLLAKQNNLTSLLAAR